MTTLEQRIAAFPVRRARIGDAEICYRETGSGEAMLLLHGVGSSSASWVDFMAEASQFFPGRRLIAWDAPGYGESSRLPQRAPVAADYAAALSGMLESLGITQMILVGHSLGALIAGAFASKHPQQVRALVLLDPAGGYGAATDEARQKMVDGRLNMLATLGPQGMAEQRGAALLSPRASAAAVDLVKWSMARVDVAGYEQAVRMLAEGRLAEDAAHFAEHSSAPLAVMCGSEDTVTPEEGCRKIAAACRGAEYRTLPGLGHAGYVESPRMVAVELDDFIRRATSPQQQQQQQQQ